MFVRSIRHKQKIKAMKSRVIELQDKANQLLELAQAMDERISFTEKNMKFYHDWPLMHMRMMNKLDTRKRGSKRLWSAYIQVLTQIKLEL